MCFRLPICRFNLAKEKTPFSDVCVFIVLLRSSRKNGESDTQPVTFDVFDTKSNEMRREANKLWRRSFCFLRFLELKNIYIFISLNYLFFFSNVFPPAGGTWERVFTWLLGGDYAWRIRCLPFNHVRRRAAEQKVSVEQTPAMQRKKWTTGEAAMKAQYWFGDNISFFVFTELG